MNKPYDVTGAIMSYEDGQLDKQGIIELFQHLVDTGRVWALQGSYGRMASYLIRAGLVHTKTIDKRVGETLEQEFGGEG